MKPIDFLFLVEHEDREMSTVMRLKLQLEKKGYSCVVLSTEFHAHYFGKYNAQNIVFPYAINSDTWPIRAFKNDKFKNANFISLNWEQLLSKANQDFKKPKSYLIKQRFYHLAWDDSFKSFLENSGVDKNNINIIGNPLHELLLEDLNNAPVYDSRLRSDFSINQDAEICFFPMNYGWAFFDDDKIEAKIRMGYQADIAFEYRQYSQRCLDSFLEFIIELSLQYDKKVFVIRPHPSISVEQYRQRFKLNGLKIPKNILITKKYTIKEWIAISKVVGSSWSTSVWDAKKIGKKVFLYTPYERPDWLETYWNPLVININKAENFDNVLASPADNTTEIGEITKSVSTWLQSINSMDRREIEFSSDFRQNIVNLFYKVRSFLRTTSMKVLNGKGVGKGLQRDYFEPIE